MLSIRALNCSAMGAPLRKIPTRHRLSRASFRSMISGQCASVACRIQNFHSVAHLKAPFRCLPAGGTNKKSCRKPTGHNTHQTHGCSSESLPVSLYRFLKVSLSLPTIAQGEAVVKGFFEFCRKSFCTVNGQGRFSQKGTASHSRMKSAVVDGIKSLFLFCLTEEFSRRNFLRRMAGHRAKRGSTKKHRQSRCSFSGVRYGTRTHGLQGHNLTR